MAQDPERNDDDSVEGLDASAELDMVTLYRSSSVDSEIEADIFRGILTSNGIPSVLTRAGAIPPLGFEVKVPAIHAEEARRLIEEAKAAGPDAAMEAERAQEDER